MAAQLALWNFTGANTVPTWTASVYNANFDSSAVITRGAGASASAGASSFRTTGFRNDGIAVTNTDYFQITLSADAGYTLSITNLAGVFAGTAGYYASPGVADQWAYSTNGSTFTLIGTAVTNTSLTRSWDISGVSALQSVPDGITVTLRYYASGRTSTGGWGFNGSKGLEVYGSLDAAASAPSVSTSPGWGTNTTKVTLGGNVTADGGATVTNRGVVYKTTSPVAISDNKTQIGTGTGAFSNEITSLSVNTRYYFRAYAQNSVDTTLGSELYVWTLANTPSAPTVANETSSTLDITVNENGNPSSTEFAIQRTNDNNYLQSDGTWGASAVWQTKSAWGTTTATNLSPSTTYYFQVKARNGANTETAFGSTGSGTTLGSGCSTYWHALYNMGGPIWTNYLGDKLAYKFEFAVNQDTTGWGVDYGIGKTTDGSGWSWYGADWSRMDGGNNRVWISKENEHQFSSTGNWYFAGRFDNSGCIYYADEDWESTTGGGLNATNFFLVSALTAPSSQSATAAGASQINLSWTRGVSGVAKDTIVFRSTNATPPTLSQGTAYTQGNSYGAYVCVYKGSGTSASDTGLTQGTQYYYYFFAVNNDYYSSIVSANATTWTTPTVTTTPVSVTNQTTAVGGGNVTATGGTTVTNRGVVWATTTGPTVPGAQTTNGTGTGSFSATLTNLVVGQTYYYRAFAQNSVGTSYGSQYTLNMPCFTSVVTGVHAASSNDTYFGAAWDPLPGASGYALDVSTNAMFSLLGAAGTYTNDFTGIGGGTVSSYLPRIWTNNGDVVWTADKARTDQTVNGDPSLCLQNAAGAFLETSLSNGIDSLRFTVEQKFAGSGGVLTILANGTQIGTFSYDTTVQTARFDNINLSGPVTLVVSNNTAARPAINDLVWSEYPSAVDHFVPGYSNRAVAGTSATVTGLSSQVTYYFRVRATNEFCTTENSATASVTTVLIAPNVVVLGTNGTVIADGETTPSYAVGTDFGAVGVNLSNVIRTFTITNSGNAALGLGTVTTSGTHAADFIVVSQPAASLAAGATTTFQVRFDPSAAGLRTATLQFTNNAAGKSPYDFAVRGTGVLAGVYASPVNITVTTMVGTAVSAATFGVTNVGRGRLDYAVTTNVGWLSVSPVSAQLAEGAGQQETITFNVAGLSAGTSNGTVSISGGATASNGASVNVTLILTNIPVATALSATADGKELVRVQWSAPSGYNVMVVHRENDGPTTPPVQGHAYSVGDSFGAAKVVYRGGGAYLDHVVPQGSMDVYVFYAINNDHYSPGVTATVSMATYGPAEHVEQFGYTNGVSLNGLNGGQGWTNAWSVGAGNFTVSSNGPTPNLYVNSNYPPVAAQRIVVSNYVNNTEMRARRDFAPVSTGVLYVSYIMAVEYGGSGKYTGLRLLSNGVERAFVGETGGDNILGLDSYGGSVNSGYNINAFQSDTGNVYLIFARYNFATRELAAKAYYRTDVVPEAEPGVWDVTATAAADRTFVNGIELVSGGFDNNQPGVAAFDEVRVARSWSEIIPSSGIPGIGLTPLAYTVTVMRGSSAVTESFAVTNIGLGVLAYDVTTNAPWISVTPTLGTLSAGIGQSHSLTLAVTDLAVGTHTGGIEIVSGSASNSPKHAGITVIVTNIPPVSGGSVNADGKEMVRIGWSPQAGVQTLILHDNKAITVDPTQGTPYSVDDAVGTARVIYIGPSSGALEHIVAQGSTNYYAAYTLNGDYTATRVNLGNVTMPLYRPEEIVDQVAYTNGTSLVSPPLAGGQGWTTAWTNSEGTWTILSNNHAEVSFPTVNVYPTNAANFIKMSDPGASTTSRVQRFFAPVSTGVVYIAAYMGYQYEGPSKFAGISFLSGGVETGFVGKISDEFHDFSLGIDTFGGGRVFSPYDVYGLSVNTNNTYLLIGKYDLTAGKIYAKAYHRTESVPIVEPVSWDASASAVSPSAIDGIMLVGGADTGTIGNVYFDEVRVALSWADLVDRHLPTVLTRPVTGIQPTTASGGGEVTSDGGLTVTNRGIAWVTNGVPTIADTHTSNGTGVGIFSSSMTGLIPGQTYYVRAYAQNAVGTSYGDVSNFTAACFTTVVTGLYVSVTNDTDFTLNWSPLAGALSYRVDVSTNANFMKIGDVRSSNILVAFDFATYAGSELRGTSITASAFMNSPAYIERGAGLTNAANGGRFNAQGWGGYTNVDDALSNSNYFEWTIEPSPGYAMSVTGALFRMQRSNTGASNIALRSSVDGFAANLFAVTGLTGGDANNLITNSLAAVPALQNVSTPVTFRLIAWGGVSGGSLGFEGTGDDLVMQGIVKDDTTESFVPGYSNRVVGGTSVVVTGLESSVTYYYRVRGTTPNCVSDNSATGAVTTLDRIPPGLFGFNVDGGMFTDEQVFNGFAVTGMVFDANAGIASGPGTPYFFIKNSVGTIIAASNKFTTAPLNGAVVPSALAGSFGPVPQASVVLGVYTTTVGAVDLMGNIVVSNFTFTVVDDDTNAPVQATLYAPVSGGGAFRHLQISIGNTNVAGTGAQSNWVYRTTDGALVSVSAGNPLRFWVGARDDSRINRGTTNPATNMNLTVDDIIVSNVANFSAALSSSYASTTNARSTNVWEWTARFTDAEITKLMTNDFGYGLGTNRISVSMTDADADRIGDSLSALDLQYGFLVVTDDDTTPPVIGLTDINGIGEGGVEHVFFFEKMGTLGTNGESIDTHETNNRFDNVSATMSGTGDMRTTSASSGYTGASGSFNVMLNASNEYFQIAGIDSSAHPNLMLSFGVRKSTTAQDGSDLTVRVSTNGTNWTTLTMPALPTGAGTVAWYLLTNTVGVIPAGTNLMIRFTTASPSEEFRIDDVRLFYTESNLQLTDGDIAWGGYVITSRVYDVDSGLAVSNAFAPNYVVLNPTGQSVVAANFLTPFANAGATSTTPIMATAPAAGSTNWVALGTYTTMVYVTDADDDLGAVDRLGATNSIVFSVIDDDTNAPVASAFFLSGGTTNFDLGDGSVIITGLLADASGVLYDGTTHFVLLDGAGNVVQSNRLYAGSGNAATGIVYAGVLNCGEDYTVRVFAADSDFDRPNDQMSMTQAVMVIRTIGVGGPADYPIASNLLVNGAAASPLTQITDQMIATGGWSMAFNLSHPVGVFTNASSPSFRITNEVVGEVVGDTPWTNGVHVGDTYYFTNNNIPGVSYASVQTGLHYVVWSASNQGSCVAMIIDRGAIADGTNLFMVVDDDILPPVPSGFAVAGQSSTIDVVTAMSGFAVTGLLHDVGSGIGFTSKPPYMLVFDVNGAVLASNTLTGGAEGDGKAAPHAVSNFLSGLTLSCGGSYTVRVYAADADNDRANDRAETLVDVMVLTTSGDEGDPPKAENLLVNNTAAGTVTLTDQMIATGGWRVAVSFVHPSEDIVTNGPNAPSFKVLGADNVDVYGTTIVWSNVSKSGSTYFATNHPMAAVDTNLVTTGRYSIIWSAQSEGLCYGVEIDSAIINPGTNRFLVIDDDTEPPNFLNAEVGGGTGSNCGGGGGCADPSRTNLIAGDIAIIAMNTLTVGSFGGGTNYDSFAWVALVDIPPGTQIKFTDNGWLASQNKFRNMEGTLTWRATNCVGAGTVVRWIATNSPQFSVGVLAASNGSFALNIEGEQIFAYQGADNAPNFIYGLNDRTNGLWDVNATDSHTTALPPGLADGYTAVAVGTVEGDLNNVIINTNVLSIAGTRETILYYVSDKDNWVGDDDLVYNLNQFNFSFPDLCASGGIITDEDMLLGRWNIAAQIQDLGSGLTVSNDIAPRFMVLNTNAGVVISNFFTTAFARGSKAANTVSNDIPGGDYYAIQLGVHTAVLWAADADADRPNDAAERRTNIAFTVVDDDYDIPQIGFFSINGGISITNAADLFSVVISGRVRDVTSGIAFTSAPPQYAVIDSLGYVVASGGFANSPTNEGAAKDWESIWTAPMNLAGIADCGIYTVRVTVADADNDRVGDRMQTNLSFLISVASGNGSDPTASNLLVNATPAPIATLTDADLRAGGWSLAMTIQHPIGVATDNPYEPGFKIHNPSDATVIAALWTNVSDVGAEVYVTNDYLAAVPYANVQTGYYSVFWSARSLGACFGEVFDSPLFADGTNLILVVDDDTVGPTAASNFVSTATYWTNNPVVTYTWDTSSVHDASGVATFRLVTNNIAPTTMVEGVNVGLTNLVTLTNLTEGIITNYLYAIDADDDRPNDGAMGAVTSTVLYLDFTPPAQVVNFSASPGVMDNTSEIDLNWTALPDGGGAHLSPWDTYRIYYTQDGGDPSTNDLYFDSSAYIDLATNATSALTLEGLAMGSEYRVAVAGRDRAGNLGPISGVQTVMLGQITITNAFANESSQTELYWDGSSNSLYDVIYADGTGYTTRIDLEWRLAATVQGTRFVDVGGYDVGSTNYRVAPIDLPNRWMRYYRIAAANAWIPTWARQGSAATQVVVALKTVLTNGHNFIGMGMSPFENTLEDFFGTNRMVAGNDLTDSASIYVYTPRVTSEADSNVWWLSSSDGWQYEIGGNSANTQALPYPNRGFDVLMPIGSAPTNFLVVGHVPWSDQPGGVLIEPNKNNVLALNLPRPTRLAETGLNSILTPAPGDNWRLGDEIRILPRGTGPFGAPRARIYISTNGTYRLIPSGALANNFVIEVDDALVVWTPKLASAVMWTMPLPYVPPHLRLTNYFPAPPIVTLQSPVDITTTSVVLRGTVIPNGLSTTAKFLYGPTTNYGFTIGLTSLPATNIAIQKTDALTGLSGGTLYYYRLYAENAMGASRFGTGSFATDGYCTNALPSAPTATASKGASLSEVLVTWPDVSGEAGYEVWRNTVNNSGTATQLATVGQNTASYNDTSAAPGQRYYYWIRSFNCAGSSGYGAGDFGHRKLATVQDVAASFNTFTTRVEISWSAVDGATGYGVYRNTSNASGGSSYIGMTGAGQLVYTDTTAVVDTDYYYWIRATNSTSASQSDFQASGTLGRRSSSGFPILSSPTATAITASSATLGATIVSDGGSAVLSRGTTWGATPVPAANSAAEGNGGTGAFSHTRTGLPAGKLIYFRGWASNNNGIAYSDDGSFWSAPPAPVPMSVTDLFSDHFQANWSAAMGATNYLLDVSTSAGFGSFVSGYNARSAGNALSLAVTGLTASTHYYWRVRAQNSGGPGDYSSTNVVQTPVAPPSIQASNISFSAVASTQMTVSWQNGNGSGRIVLARQGASPVAPQNGVVYTANSTFGAGSEIGTGTYVVEDDSGSAPGATESETVNGLSPSTAYFFKVYEYNGSGATISYAPAAGVGNPNGQMTTP